MLLELVLRLPLGLLLDGLLDAILENAGNVLPSVPGADGVKYALAVRQTLNSKKYFIEVISATLHLEMLLLVALEMLFVVSVKECWSVVLR